MYLLCFLQVDLVHGNICGIFFFFMYILLIMLLQLSHFFSPLHPAPPLSLVSPTPLSSHLWVIHISSLASPFPILFLTSPCLFCTYHLCFLFTVPFLPFSPHHADNPPCHLHFCVFIPVLVVGLVCFCSCFLGSVVDSCEFFVILLFIFDHLFLG